MEVVALSISVLSMLVAGCGLVWNELRWRAERKSDVRVLVWHDGMGMDIYSAEAIELEHVIALRVFNHGERPERPKATKIVDDPPPEAREVPPRGQLAAQFKLPEAAIGDGFIGYATLGTGERVYSVPATPDLGLGELRSEIRDAIAGEDRGEENPESSPS